MPFSLKDTNDLGLCGSCDSAFITRGHRPSDTRVVCNWTHPAKLVTFLVRSCTGYEERGKPSSHDFEKIAWVLEVKPGRATGFRPPKRDDQ